MQPTDVVYTSANHISAIPQLRNKLDMFALQSAPSPLEPKSEQQTRTATATGRRRCSRCADSSFSSGDL